MTVVTQEMLTEAIHEEEMVASTSKLWRWPPFALIAWWDVLYK